MYTEILISREHYFKEVYAWFTTVTFLFELVFDLLCGNYSLAFPSSSFPDFCLFKSFLSLLHLSLLLPVLLYSYLSSSFPDYFLLKSLLFLLLPSFPSSFLYLLLPFFTPSNPYLPHPRTLPIPLPPPSLPPITFWLMNVNTLHIMLAWNLGISGCILQCIYIPQHKSS